MLMNCTKRDIVCPVATAICGWPPTPPAPPTPSGWPPTPSVTPNAVDRASIMLMNCTKRDIVCPVATAICGWPPTPVATAICGWPPTPTPNADSRPFPRLPPSGGGNRGRSATTTGVKEAEESDCVGPDPQRSRLCGPLAQGIQPCPESLSSRRTMTRAAPRALPGLPGLQQGPPGAGAGRGRRCLQGKPAPVVCPGRSGQRQPEGPERGPRRA